jgi:hypothetical protein
MKHVHRQVTTLREVVQISGDHSARQTSHCVMLREDLMIVYKKGVYVTRYPRGDFQVNGLSAVLEDLPVTLMTTVERNRVSGEQPSRERG